MSREKLEKNIAKLKDGDAGAFDYIYEHTHRSVYFAILYVVRERTRAEDILQDTYVRAISHIEQYREHTNFVGWLCTIGKMLAINSLKKYHREVPTDFEQDAGLHAGREQETPFLFDLAAKYLAEDEYQIVMLCQVAGYKRREVADMLKMPVGTVTWKNNQALSKLKKILSQEDSI